MSYKETLNLPNTDFPMRGNLGEKEVLIQDIWKEKKLYKKNLELNKEGESFVLHDGPPYANGDIHIGHAMNKILKDFVVRYKTMRGFKTRYIPGWDTHGLPIETALSKKGVNRKKLTKSQYRNLCKQYAEEQIERQRKQFKRLGILGEWSNPYVTFQHEYEADQVLIFSKMVEKGLIYKGLKPVFWSPSSETALAEAEIEYIDIKDTSIYVAFKLSENTEEFNNVSLIIWTTTPWTLPANRATAVNPKLRYVLVETNKGKFILSKDLIELVSKKLSFENVVITKEFYGEKLEGLKYFHPLNEKVCPVILGDHVTAEDGSGIVHTAPGHGEEDYIVGKKYGLEIYCPVDEKGYMMDSTGQFKGLFYRQANNEIIEFLKTKKTLLDATEFVHSYPHDWRTKKPVIFRATPQWFASIKKIKEPLLKSIKDVKWYPKWGETRLSNMISSREDWCISRQRSWGVPIPVLYTENGEPILDSKVLNHIASIFSKRGSNSWYELDPKDLLPKGYKNINSPNDIYFKESDIMDVWFDSGTSFMILKRNGEPFPADLYLEGSDQYRGWFNSSLSTSVASFGHSPYKAVLSHGFTLDGNGRKMSKSIGNTVDPLKVMKQKGADILRLWVASTDYQQDVRISEENLKQISEGYRKIRNTLRYILGNLSDFDLEKDYIGYSMRGNLNRAITLKLKDLYSKIFNYYENYDFDKVYRTVLPYIINDLSAFYLDFTKDKLYLELKNDFERRAIQSTFFDIIMTLLKLLTPIIPHTTSEAYEKLNFKKYSDVYLERIDTPTESEDPFALRQALEDLLKIRLAVNSVIEDARNSKLITKTMQAEISVKIPKKMNVNIQRLNIDLKEILMVAKVNVKEGESLQASLRKFDGDTCERCWNVFEKLNSNVLCERCNKVVEALK